MVLQRLLTDEELLRNVRRRQTAGDELQDLDLAVRQKRLAVLFECHRRLRLLQHRLGELLREHDVAGRGEANGLDNVGGLRIFGDEADCPRTNRLTDDVGLAVHRQDDDPVPPVTSHDLAGRRDSISVFHGDVHHDDPGFQG